MYRELEDAVFALQNEGIYPVFPCGISEGEMALLLLDAVNRAAKVICPSFYSLKPALAVRASNLPGVHSGWHLEENVFYLSSKNVGVVSVHDPKDEIKNRLQGVHMTEWPFEFSGIRTQEFALELIQGNFEFLNQDSCPWNYIKEINC